MAESCDVVVIGAGVIGLAVGRALALAGREVLILEQHDAIATETSSRNSEVIHAGIYYPTGSNKAIHCVRGKHQLYRYCAEHRVPHENIGKLIVAADSSQLGVLRSYQQKANTNGAGQLRWVEKDELHHLEPEVLGVAAVYSPTTGIIDSHSYMLALQGDFEGAGGMVAFNSKVNRLIYADSLVVECDDIALAPKILVNAAGLDAPRLSQSIGNAFETHYAIGHYYTLSGKSPFNRLVYPIAESGGLGVHVTLDIAHQVRFGPDVRWIDSHDYTFDDSQRDRFVAAIRAYYPGLDESKLNPGYTGIRPKLAHRGNSDDFVIRGPKDTQIDNYVELLGIESPGLTASLSIADTVISLLFQTS